MTEELFFYEGDIHAFQNWLKHHLNSENWEALKNDNFFTKITKNRFMNLKMSQQRRKFTEDEDNKPYEIISRMGARNWRSIAEQMPGRSGRQCRDRYSNYLMKHLRNDPWTPEEDALLLDKYAQFGSHWSEMVCFFQGRSSNSIKNRWYTNISHKFSKNQQNIQSSSNIVNLAPVANITCLPRLPSIPIARFTQIPGASDLSSSNRELAIAEIDVTRNNLTKKPKQDIKNIKVDHLNDVVHHQISRKIVVKDIRPICQDCECGTKLNKLSTLNFMLLDQPRLTAE
ncbi:hypothetical protein TRFO_33722 [Tritrichomonas foetus]|uniref:Myb-like DNA-binding domain containing protein n=1 Tax=Tritrichomonas foetus TaxID=1144522 RepID=A0A1J4JKZ5_9EUKA|nr:hypothetical protein TRFO_33722 [Tritrichomonas foetus]|eukprot:OHS99762.1 hypothetical protein TRFO_33722 [Tritrichomonas foetus]